MIKCLLITAFIFAFICPSIAQNIQGSLKQGIVDTKLIMMIKNNGTTTVQGNLNEVQFTINLGSYLDAGKETFLPSTPGVSQSVRDSAYWNFGTKSTLIWRGSLPITLAPGETLDMIDFIVTNPMTGTDGPSSVAMLAGRFEGLHVWSVKMDGLQVADQVNRFFDSGQLNYFFNEELGSWASIAFQLSSFPVKLRAFSIRNEVNTAMLNWSTTEEVNSRHFEVEKSKNALDWVRIATVNSVGESKTNQHYAFTDLNPSAGQNYYRLKMVDKDDTFAYSKVVIMHLHRLQGIYPNPTKGIVTLNGISAQSVDILNVEGRVVKKNIVVKNNQIDFGKVQPGIYIIKIIATDAIETSVRVVVE